MKRCLFILFIAVILVSAGGCGKKNINAERDYNVVLIVADTLRSDYLSCYGNRWIKTPSIDSIAKDGILFENAISHASWTLPSHASLMTSRYPIQHGCLSYNNPLSEKETTLAEVLKQDNFTTGAFISTFLVSSKFAFQQGFDTFDEKLDADFQRPVTEFHADSLRWIEKKKNGKFFLWLHYFEPHYPYLPHVPFTDDYEKILNKEVKGTFDRSHEWIKDTYNKKKEDLSEADTNRMRSLYAGEISYLDRFIGEVISKLKEEGVYDKTLIIFTSDHGEMLGEHHLIEHGESLYQEEIHVPLIIKLPADMKYTCGARVNEIVEHVDVMPTLIDLLGVKSNIKLEGKSLRSLMSGSSGNNSIVKAIAHSEVHNYKSLISGNLKLIMSLPVLDSPMLFDIDKDPGEKNNIYYEEKEKAKEMKNRLLDWVMAMNNPAPAKTRLTREEEDKLKSLGYINAGVNRTLVISTYPPSGLTAEVCDGIVQSYLSGNKIQMKEEKWNGTEIQLNTDGHGKEGTVEFWFKPAWEWNKSDKVKVFSLNAGKSSVINVEKVGEALDTNEGKVYKGSFLRVGVSSESGRFVYYDVSRLSDNIPHHILLTWKNIPAQGGGKILLFIDGIKDEFSPELKFTVPLNEGISSITFGDGNKKENMSDLKIYRNFYESGSMIMQVYRKALEYAETTHETGK